MGGLIEPELRLQLLDEGRRNAPGASGLAARRDVPAAALHAGAGLAGEALEAGQHLVDGAARRRLDDDEVEQHDPQQGGDHQQQAAQYIAGHGVSLLHG